MMITLLLPLLTVIEIMLGHYDACDVDTFKTIYSLYIAVRRDSWDGCVDMY